MSHDETPHDFAFPRACTLKDKKGIFFTELKPAHSNYNFMNENAAT